MRFFEPGIAYRLHACIGGAPRESLIAVVAERNRSTREVMFVLPKDLLVGRLQTIDGREFVTVNLDGRDYTASAAAPLDLSASTSLLRQLREPGRFANFKQQRW